MTGTGRCDGGTDREIQLEPGDRGTEQPHITNDEHGRAVLIIPGEYELVLGARLCEQPPRVDEYADSGLSGGPSSEVEETMWLLEDEDDPNRWVFIQPTLRSLNTDEEADRDV